MNLIMPGLKYQVLLMSLLYSDIVIIIMALQPFVGPWLRFHDIVIIFIMALQPFVGPWLLFQFLDPVHSQ
jgi:hypothetical protein